MNILQELNDYRSKYSKNLKRGAINTSKLSYSYISKKKKLSSGPLYVGWDPTYRCNAKCVYCDRWRDKDMFEKELTKEEALKFITDLKDLKVWMLSIGGGEPLLVPHILDAIKIAKKNNICVNINTNGYLLKKFAKDLVNLKVDSITISVESHIKEIHDKIRNTNNLYKKLTEGIEEIKRLRKNKIPSLKIRMVINKDQYKSLPEAIKFWKTVVDEVVLQPIHNFDLHLLKVPENMSFSEIDKENFKSVFRKIQKENKEFTKNYYNEFENFFFNPKSLKQKYRCYAGFFTMHVNPDGNVYACTSCVGHMGNLKESSINDIWNSKKAKDFRNIIRNNENKCFCWYNCTGTFSASFDKLLNRS